jgi:hypothetical protein
MHSEQLVRIEIYNSQKNWIPAFAGITKGAEIVYKIRRRRFIDNYNTIILPLTPTLSHEGRGSDGKYAGMMELVDIADLKE